ncbi:Protein patched/dispatched protein [Dioscorea alata]|uniref:Protein patched/dispatched protein n=1 Tax=Dioscorea alata TaxID=55571 RepID=A0ACB7UU42_DIOAL|nr:Protein patched/dispatched protein [Dioscorea alata]
MNGKSLQWRLVIGAFYLLQAIVLTSPISAVEPHSHPPRMLATATSEKKYAPGYCSMYGICGQRSDGKVLNCPNNTQSVKPDALLSSKIQNLCPTITGNICCSQEQFDTLRSQVQQAVPLLVGCPACLRNFLNLFCELSCSPDQSLFINVTSVSKVNNSLAVDGIDFYATSTYGEELFNSCKDVKFGTLNTRAMDFVGGGAQNYEDWFAFLGRRANLNEAGSPYAITFRPNISDSSGMKPMNSTVYSCGDPSLGCSCGDCSSSSLCTENKLPVSQEKHSCFIRIGSLKIKCIVFSLGIVYVALISAIFGWGIIHLRRKKTGPSSKTKPLLNVMDETELPSINNQEQSAQPIQISGGVPPVARDAQFSIVQGYLSKLFRKYGSFVSRNPTLVLCSSIVLPLLLCIGLIRFKVETRPEKLWVSPGSKAAEEKYYFDHHLAPFYRIEQLILATLPDPKDAKAPTIVTEQNIKLLFEIQKKVDGLRANYSGTMVSLTDICLKPLGEDCATQSVLQYFKMDPQNYDAYGGVQHAEYCFEHYSSGQTCLSAFQAPLDPSTVLGGFSEHNYSEASAFVITYPVNNEVDETDNANEKAVAWERAFINLIEEELVPMVQLQNLTLSFSSESSIQEELKRESTADVITILISYLVMFAYISFTLGGIDQFSSIFISSKVMLGLSGVVVVMLSVLASIGLFSSIGVKSTLIIMEVIPFLVLADVHAPFLGLPGVKLIVIAVFVAIAFASIALSTKLQPGLEQQIALPRDSYLQDYFNDLSKYLKVGPPLYFVVKDFNYSLESNQTNQLCSISQCDSNSLANEITKASLTPESSYIAKPAASWLDDFLVWLSPEAFGCCRKFVNGSYCPPDDQPPCCQPDKGSCSVGGICNDCTMCFLSSDLHNGRPSTVQFKEKLPWFLDALPSSNCAKGGKGAYTSSVDLTGYDSGLIQASSFRTYHTPLNKQSDYVSSMKAALDFSSRISDALQIQVFPYSVFYIFFEQYLHIWKTAVINIAIGLGAVFVVCLVITCSLWTSSIILMVLAMIIVDMMGVMALLEIQLNAVSVVNLVMSVGIAVEFCVHITHAFSIASGDRETRAKEALCTMGASVFSGITLTKLVGVIVLHFARSELFVVYYFKMFLALVLIGFLHGLVFLPVVLSICGPPSRFVPVDGKRENQPAAPAQSS